MNEPQMDYTGTMHAINRRMLETIYRVFDQNEPRDIPFAIVTSFWDILSFEMQRKEDGRPESYEALKEEFRSHALDMSQYWGEIQKVTDSIKRIQKGYDVPRERPFELLPNVSEEDCLACGMKPGEKCRSAWNQVTGGCPSSRLAEIQRSSGLRTTVCKIDDAEALEGTDND